MELNLIEKFILLTLDAKKGNFLLDSLSLNYGIAGAILLELSELNKINIEKKKLILVDSTRTNNKVVDGCIKLIHTSNKNKKIKYWINKIGNNSSEFKKLILENLVHKEILRIDKSSYMWGLFNRYRYPITNLKPIEEQSNKLRWIVLENGKPDLESILLLSLMNSCKLTRILFINKSENKAANKRIKELTQNIEISNTVSQALKEIQAAVLIATTSSFVGSSSS